MTKENLAPEGNLAIVCPVTPETPEVAAGPETETKPEQETSEDTDAENPEQSAEIGT